MKASEIIVEHSDWPIDGWYTEERLAKIRKAIEAIQFVSKSRGIEFTFEIHFYRQLILKRGMSQIDHNMLIDTFGKIINRGLHLFMGKNEGTGFAFYDPENNLNVGIVKIKKRRYAVRTIVRDVKWIGTYPKVTL